MKKAHKTRAQQSATSSGSPSPGKQLPRRYRPRRSREDSDVVGVRWTLTFDQTRVTARRALHDVRTLPYAVLARQTLSSPPKSAPSKTVKPPVNRSRLSPGGWSLCPLPAQRGPTFRPLSAPAPGSLLEQSRRSVHAPDQRKQRWAPPIETQTGRSGLGRTMVGTSPSVPAGSVWAGVRGEEHDNGSYTSANQINAEVPFGVDWRSQTTMQVTGPPSLAVSSSIRLCCLRRRFSRSNGYRGLANLRVPAPTFFLSSLAHISCDTQFVPKNVTIKI